MVREELSRRERQIVDVLFERVEASAAEIRGAMSDPPSDATVRTILRILEEKGLVKHRRDGKRFVYRMRKSKAGEGKTALRRVLDVFYGGSVEDALAAHLADPKAQLSAEELQRLREMIDQVAKGTGR
jgi:predicted transcriptional regulator